MARSQPPRPTGRSRAGLPVVRGPRAAEPSRREGPLFGSSAKVAAAAALSLGAGYLIARALGGDARPRGPTRQAAVTPRERRRLDRSRRLLSSGSALLSFSAVADSGLEHSRGRYHDPFMYLAPTLSAVTLGASIFQAVRRSAPAAPGYAIHLAAAATGLTGFGFHLYNIGKRVGGFSLLNLMYGAPPIAPGTLLGAGAAGLAAEDVRRQLRGAEGTISGRKIALGTAGAMLGTAVEVGLLHYRGAYQNPYMILPVTLPPLAAAGLVAAAADRGPRTIAMARTLNGATAFLGVLGTAFHAYGIHRNMGGWRNWSQMVFQGPPLPAPPGFTGVALASLGALDLLECGR